MTAQPIDPKDLAGLLVPVERWLVVVDFDGTLSPIVKDPDAAQPVPAAVGALATLCERTRVAVITGRAVADVRGRLGPLPVVWAGGHGAEIVDHDGRHARLVDPGDAATTLLALRADLEAMLDPAAGWYLEAKDASLAVHYRRVDPEVVAATLPAVRAALERRTGDPPGFEVMTGKAVVELRVRGADKGAALTWIADRTPGLEPLVIGDDVTDEDAFRVAVQRGGQAVLVAEAPRPSAAGWRIRDPDDVTVLLSALAAGTGNR